MAISGITMRPVNPSTRSYKWSGDKGKKDAERLSYWDKEKEEVVLVKKPFEFIVLAASMSANGWDDRAKKGLWSTEVLWTGKWAETLEKTVRLNKDNQEIASGSLAEMKARSDVNLYSHLYIYNLETKQIERLLGSGSGTMTNSIRQMIFSKEEHAGYFYASKVFTLDGTIETDRGFFRPKFVAVRDLTPEEDALQTELSELVSNYLDQGAPEVRPVVEEIPTVEEVSEEIDLSEVPF